MNRTLFPTETAYHQVHLPPNYLGASEEAQIESRIETFVASLKVPIPPSSSPAVTQKEVPTPSNPSSPG